MSTAAQKVFQIPELLEEIIFQLPNPDVLILQRVNKAFTNAVERCGDIQRKLFLSQPFKAGDGSKYINPLISPALRYHGIAGCMFPIRYEESRRYGATRAFVAANHHLSSNDMRIRANERISIAIHSLGRPVFAADLQRYKHILIGDTPVRFHIGLRDHSSNSLTDITITTLGELVEACWDALHEVEGLRGENEAWQHQRWW